MQTRLQMRTALRGRTQSTAQSTLLTDTRLNNELGDAYTWAKGLFAWPDLERTYLTSTAAGYNYYDYPQDFKTFSITDLIIDGEEYAKKDWDEWKKFIRDNPQETDKYFADHQRFYFVTPTPSTTGSNNIEVTGQIQGEALDGDSDVTIWSYSDEDTNEAIVDKANAELIRRNRPQEAQVLEQKAIKKLAETFKKVMDRKAVAQNIDKPLFDTPDYFSSNGNTSIGNFTFRR